MRSSRSGGDVEPIGLLPQATRRWPGSALVSSSMSVERFDNRQAQVVGALCAALFALIGLSMVVAPAGSSTRLYGACFTLLSVLLAVQALRSSCVVVDDSAVVTRSIVRTRRYLFVELRGVDVAVGRTGFNGFGREFLVLHLSDGRDVVFKELNCKPSKEPGEASVVTRASACIAERLSDH